jgi:hypothetical protein
VAATHRRAEEVGEARTKELGEAPPGRGTTRRRRRWWAGAGGTEPRAVDLV